MDSKRQGMTIEEMERELEFMREWDEYLKRVAGYDMLCKKFPISNSKPFREMDKTRRAD